MLRPTRTVVRGRILCHERLPGAATMPGQHAIRAAPLRVVRVLDHGHLGCRMDERQRAAFRAFPDGLRPDMRSALVGARSHCGAIELYRRPHDVHHQILRRCAYGRRTRQRGVFVSSTGLGNADRLADHRRRAVGVPFRPAVVLRVADRVGFDSGYGRTGLQLLVDGITARRRNVVRPA